MTDRPLRGKVIGSSVIASVAARAARETPGILRLGPPLGQLVARVRSAARNTLRRVPDTGYRTSRDGVFAAVSYGRATVDVEVATDARFNALEVAADLQERVRHALRRTGVAVSSVNVTILAIEDPPPPAAPGR
ncbi:MULTISPECIES: Asp23/Gls24 family envelope stress response protein [unclassified Arthrobacter]|uniref:Asp23/Gls24 family envelope stress response protein n=1 Tax=unclassified Arthrobacter TaxID=235627 RepID=UPI000CE30716|nr:MULTISPECIES: Asp23/Gls24 family envelope stress response protein [unclassified Arthrobacter]